MLQLVMSGAASHTSVMLKQLNEACFFVRRWLASNGWVALRLAF
jgi:hypothetical protein